jgi:hypothetical protein
LSHIISTFGSVSSSPAAFATTSLPKCLIDAHDQEKDGSNQHTYHIRIRTTRKDALVHQTRAAQLGYELAAERLVEFALVVVE